MFVIVITMKKDSAPDTSCTRREIHQLSISDGINVWGLILIHVKKTRRHCETRTEVSWFTTSSEIGRIDPEMNRSYWYDTCFVVVKNNSSYNVSRLFVNIRIFIICRSCKVFLTFTAFIRLCLTRWSVTQQRVRCNTITKQMNSTAFAAKFFVEQTSTDSRATVVISVTTEKYLDFRSSREITCVSW